MSTYRRNVLVGVVMLAALVMLGWMILRFGGMVAQPFAGEMIRIQFVTDRAEGVSDGSGVYFRGVNVGRVVRVELDKQNLTDIRLHAEVEAAFPLPAGMTARIRQASLLGSGARVEFITNGEVKPGGPLLKSGDEVRAQFVGLEFFPEEIKNLSTELSASARQFREANVVGKLNDRLDEVGQVLQEARKTLDSANQIVANEQVRADILASIENVKASTANIRAVTERADKITTKMEGAVDNIDKASLNAQSDLDAIAKATKMRLEEVAGVVQKANAIATKINDGTGTAGQLINDPKLYQGLVDTTAELNLTIKDLRRLVQQWEEEGVPLKLR
jgi:phospholipid/cholesterol/gamma-HCH transport system substrate-binding protein